MHVEGRVRGEKYEGKADGSSSQGGDDAEDSNITYIQKEWDTGDKYAKGKTTGWQTWGGDETWG